MTETAYKAPQQLYNPGATLLQGSVNNSAQRAFKSLQGLLQQGGQVYQQQLDIDLKTAKEKNQEALQDELLGASTDFTAISNQFTTEIDRVGNDREKLAELHLKTNDALALLEQGLSKDTQLKMKGAFESLRRKVATDYATKDLANNKNDTSIYIGQVMPTYASLDPEIQKQVYLEGRANAERQGISKKWYGDTFLKTMHLYNTTQVDGEALANGYDYSQVYKLEESLKRLEDFDPAFKSKDSYITAMGHVKKLKDSIDSNLSSTVNLAIQTTNRSEFERFLDKGLDNGAYSKEQADMLRQKFAEASLKDKGGSGFGAVWKASGGMLNNTDLSGKMLKENSKAVKAYVAEMHRTGAYNTEWIKYHASQNPELIKTSFNQKAVDLVSELVSAVNNGNADVLAKAQHQLGELRRVGHGLFDEESLVMLDLPKVIGDINNVPDAWYKFREASNNIQGKLVSARDNDYVKKIMDFPRDSRESAHRMFSILHSMNQPSLTDEKIFDLVETHYKHHEVEDLDLKVSGGLHKKLSGLGLKEEAYGKLEEFLVLSMTPKQQNDYLAMAEAGEVSFESRPGMFVFRQGDNTIVMPTGKTQEPYVIEEATQGKPAKVTYDREAIAVHEANKALPTPEGASGGNRLLYDFTNRLAVATSIVADRALAKLNIPLATLKGGAKIASNNAKAYYDFSNEISKHRDTMLDDVVYQGMSFFEARDKMYKNYVKSVNKWNETTNLGSEKANEEFLQEINESFEEIFK